MKAIRIKGLVRTIALASGVLLFGVASPASATWQLYVSGDFGYSIAKSKVTGDLDTTGVEGFSGKDSDVSPAVGGAFGLEVPMFELTPWRLPYDWRLPEWPVRFEFEASGLREYRPKTDGLVVNGTLTDDPVYSKVKTWTFMSNLWIDIPLRGLHRPIRAANEFMFRDPRMPRLQRALDPLSMYAGVGIGFAHVSVKADNPDFGGSNKKYDFAYQFGTGLGYQLTDYINLGMGYRFIKHAKLKSKVAGTADEPGDLRLTSDIHEVRFVARVRIFDLPYPWR